jgi:hypothetical protein
MDPPGDQIAPLAQPAAPAKEYYRATTLILLIGAVGFVWWRAWVCDDAFITFRHVANFLAGHGPVFNVGERVQGFTHPLWFLILSAGGLVINLYPWAVTLGLLSTAAIVLVLAGYFRRRPHGLICLLAMMGILLSSRTFVEYQTSGLETCLTHLLVIWLWAWLAAAASKTGNEHGNGRAPSPPLTRRVPALTPSLTKGRQVGVAPHADQAIAPAPAGIVLLCSLLMLTRPDHIVPCIPLLALAASTLLRHRRRRDWLVCLLAAMPLLAWYGFATVYYGTPLPNTAYAKIGLPRGMAILHGLAYLRDYGTYEPGHAAIIALVLIVQTVLSVRDLASKRAGAGIRLALVLAIWLQLAYVVVVGGDFMRGRFLSVRLVASAVLAGDLIARLSPTRSWRTGFSVALIIGLVWSFGRAESQFSGVRAIGPPGIHPIFALVFLSVTGLGALLLTALLMRRKPLPPGRVAACLILAASGLCTLLDFRPRTSETARDGIADEYAWYSGTWRDSRFAPPARYPVEVVNEWVQLGRSAGRYSRQHGPIALPYRTIGLLGYYAGPDVQIIDLHGLTEPFIARLPADPRSRVGHMQRDVPEEYRRSRMLITELPDWRRRLDEGDPSLAADARALPPTTPWRDSHLEHLWKDIRTVTRGPIWSADRWRLIPRYARGR